MRDGRRWINAPRRLEGRALRDVCDCDTDESGPSSRRWRELLAACAKANDAQWNVRPELYEQVLSVVVIAWPSVLHWIPDSWAITVAGLDKAG